MNYYYIWSLGNEQYSTETVTPLSRTKWLIVLNLEKP